MAIKVLLIPGWALPKKVWAEEAKYVSANAPWIDDVMISGGNPLGSYEERGEQIAADVRGRILPEDQVIIVGHSFGGIVARYAAQGGLLRPRCIVTVASPHQGVFHAEAYVRTTRDQIGPRCAAWMLRRIYKFIAASLGTNDRVLFQLSLGGMRKFNEMYTDVEGTSYFSYACIAEKVSRALTIPHLLLSVYTGQPNDGVVTMESAKWGQFMGTVTCDHLEVVGAPGPNRFDSGKFLLSVLEEMRREVK